MDIRHALQDQAEQTPDSLALLSIGRAPLTYSRLLAHCSRFVADLNHAGISRGDRVAIVLPNGPEMAACLLAITAGASCAPLNPNYRQSEFEFYLSDLAPRALIVEDGSDVLAIAVAESLGIRVIRLRPTTDDAAGIFTLDLDHAPDNTAPIYALPDDEALVLHTSGTTARPKMVPLTQSNLAASARNIAASLALDSSDRCLNVMPLFHIHGFVGALLSTIAAGGSIACTPGFQAPRFLDWCDEFAPTWYTAVPTMHQAVLARATESPVRLANLCLRFIRSCSAPLAPELMAEMEQTFRVPVLEAYGMTEASHQIATNPQPPAARKPGSVGIASGTDVAIMDADGNILAPEEVGEIVLRGAGVTAGYANNPEANRTSFNNGWFRTGDNGRLDRDGYLFITGRIKEIINRGGQKISPREIDEVLCTHPAVASAVAFAVPDHRLGEDVAAAVVLRAGHAASEIEIRNHAATRIAQYKVPRRIVFLDELPKGPTGKLQRIGLAAQLGLNEPEADSFSSNRATEFVAPSTPRERTLTFIWAQVLGLERIGVRDDFLALGGDSMLAALIIARIREATGAPLSILNFFEHPTVAELAALLDRGGEDRLNANEPIVAASTDGDLPLSSAQRRMWFLAELEQHSTAYNRGNLFRVRGPIDPQALDRALNRIVARHAILRTIFQSRDGDPVQIVTAPAAIELAKLDLSETIEASRLQTAVATAAAVSNRPFDLTCDPMLRPMLIKLAENDHLLLLAMHHIAFDGWSAGVVMRELSAFYASDVAGNSADAPAEDVKPLAIQYADFARWQSQAAHSPAMRESLAWWHNRLAGAPPLLVLPTDRPRPARETFSGAAETFVIPAELVDRLKQTARDARATLFMTLLAAFQTMLHRYGAGDDIVVGTPVAGRTRVETEGLIGLFVNMLAMRGDLSGDPTFRELLVKTRDRALEAYAHQDLPFDAVVESLNPERNLSYPPIIQVTFQIRNYPLEDTRLGSLEVEEIDFDPGVAQFDLSLEVTEKSHGLFCKLIYNRDIFDRETIERMVGHFETLLDGIATGPNTRISRLPILTAAERNQLLVDWNDTARDYPHECVHRQFEAQVARTPNAVAVQFDDSQMTYADLNSRANRVARALLDAGVTPRSFVAICIDRSLAMLTGLLGILKAGAAYVPLGPGFPRERLDFMLHDCAAPVVVTTTSLAEKFAALDVRVVCIDRDLDAGIAANPQIPITADDDAYVLYTSGSTGKPKGVAISHRSFSNLLTAMRSEISFTADDVLLAVTTLSFDIAGLELFLPLICGGRVAVADELAADGEHLAEAIAATRPTVIQMAPALWRILVASGWRGAPNLRIISGGEALTRTLADQLLDRADIVFNAYGPTETTIWSTIHRVERGDGPVPIGHPLANTQLHVLDSARQLLPIGVPGELYIGGDGVARAYLGRPDLSAERFVANPFASGGDGRLYRTGDTVKRLRNGDIEYIGRADNQVKIQGIRIEPGEIESTLMRHPQVQTVAVVGMADASDVKTLVAFVEPKPGQSPSAPALRSFLSESLPIHMIPTRFVLVDRIALTHNGKIDRTKLPSLDQSPVPAEQKYTAPRDDIDNRLQSIWEDILQLRPIGIHQDFYEVGGHSLLAVKVLVRIEREFNCNIPLAAMFPAPTIASLADRITRDLKDSERPATELIQPLGVLPPLLVVGHFPLFRKLSLRLGTNRPLIGLSIPDELRMRLPYSLDQLAGFQVKSILELNKGEPILLIGFSAEGVLAYEVARQLVCAGRDVALVAMIDTACPSQPREPMLIRIARSMGIHLRVIRSGGMERAPTAITDILSRLALRLKVRAWKLAGRVGIAREPMAPKRPADLVMAMVLATRRYIPPPYRGRVLLFKQTVDREGRFRFKDYGWGAVVQDGLEVCEIPGEHLTLLVEPGVNLLAAKLDAAMKSACESFVESKSAAAR